MPSYKVSLTRTQTFYMDVTADDQEEALDLALEEAPEISAVESGWGQEWSIDCDDWEELEVEEVK